MEFGVRFILCEAMLNVSGREKQGSAFCPKWYDISDSALNLDYDYESLWQNHLGVLQLNVMDEACKKQRDQSSHALNHPLLYHLFHSNWKNNLQSEL